MPKKFLTQTDSVLSRSNTSILLSPTEQQILQQIYATPKQLPVVNNTKNTTTNCRSSFQSAKVMNNNDPVVVAAKRLSCNELECLKERFVDFIKLDANSINATSVVAASTNIRVNIKKNSVDFKSGDDDEYKGEEEEETNTTGL